VFCKNCGKEIQGTPEFCSDCGAKQSESVAVETRDGKSKVAAILLAVFLAFFTWLYTYKKDAWKFWVGVAIAAFIFFLNIITFGIAGLFTWIFSFGVWLWSVIDTAGKSNEWYNKY
jgi:hypothetical protein